MHHNKSIIFACLSLIILNSCEKEQIEEYKPVGKFANRTTAETEALKILVNQYSSLPASGYYKLKYEFDDDQLPVDAPYGRGYRHAIWYDKANEHLAVEFDIHSGWTCRWNKINQQSLQKIIDSEQGLAGANQIDTTKASQQGCLNY